MRKLKIEWFIQVTKSRYNNAKSKVRASNSYNPLLSPLLFIIVMEPLSREFQVSCPWELLYVDDLVIVAETFDKLERRLEKKKEGLEHSARFMMHPILKLNQENSLVLFA